MSTISGPQASQSRHQPCQKLCGVDLKVATIAMALLSIIGGGIAYAYFPVAGIALFSVGGAGIIASLVAYAITRSKEIPAEPPSEWEVRNKEEDSSEVHAYRSVPYDLNRFADQSYAAEVNTPAYQAAEVSNWVREFCFAFRDAKEKTSATHLHLEVAEAGRDPLCSDPVLLVAAQLKAAHAAEVELIFHPAGDFKTVIDDEHAMHRIISEAKRLARGNLDKDNVTNTQVLWCPRVVKEKPEAFLFPLSSPSHSIL